MDTPQGGAITFESAFVDNATRTAVDPSTTTGKLTAFDVWGFVKEYDGTVFDDKDVTLTGGTWGYEGTQFWVPNQPYYFAALAPMNSANLDHELATGDAAKLGLGTLTFTNVNGTEDVLYATAHMTSKGLNTPNDPVKFQFKHLLSKVKFTFKNSFTTDNTSIKVTNIKMTAPAEASINVAQADYSKAWNLVNETVTLAFGDVKKLTAGEVAECADERLTIPATASYKYNVTFDVELFIGAQSVYTVSKSSTVTGVELEMGKAYNFTAEINPDNLEFDAITFDIIEVNDWVNAGDVPSYVGKTVSVSDAAEFAAAVNDPEVAAVVLNNDIELGSSTLTRAGEEETVIAKSFVLDGNGKTLTYTGSNRVIDIVSEVENETYKNVTIKNITINCTASYLERGINYNANGRLHLEGVTFAGTAPTYAVNLPGMSDNAYVTIKNCELTGNIALNVWGENMRIDVENSVLTSVDNTTAEDYTAIALNSDGSTSAEGTVVNITGGKIIARNQDNEPSYAIRNSTATGKVITSETTEVIGDRVDPVAIVDYGTNQFYSCNTLERAINKAAETNGAKVKLITDIELTEQITITKGQNITLNLNGHDITMESTSEQHAVLFEVSGNLDIVGEGTIALTGDNFPWNSSYRYATINIRETGAVTLGNGVEVICEASKDGAYGMSYAVDIYTTGTLTVDGASLHSNYIAVRCFYGASVVNVNSGSTITSSNKNYGIWLQNATGAQITIADDVEYTLEESYGIYIFGE